MSASDSAERPAADVLEDVERAIAALESHPDPAVRDATGALLQGIDAVHRAGLGHMVSAIQAMAGEAFLNRLTAVPAIRLLLMSYNLIAVDRRLQAEEALDAVRGHLHDHGIDVEILEVVGGVVTVRLHARQGAVGEAAPAAARRDMESALMEGFIGFQELIVRDRRAPEGAAQLVPVDALRRARRPVYHDALALADLPDGTMRAVEVAGVPLLLASVAGDVYALRNRCGDGPLPLEFGTLSGAEVRCSWHGCRYDVRSGRRVDADAERLPVFPVSVEGGRVRVALAVESQAGGA